MWDFILFWILFFILTCVYAAMTLGIIVLIAKYYNEEPRKYLADNNTPLFALFGAFAVTFVIACFNFGPALLLPENLPTPEQRGALSNFLHHLWAGKNVPPATTPKESLPWATGTWFWWKATGIYLLLTIMYVPIGLWDEASTAIKSAKALLAQRHAEALVARQQAYEVALEQAKNSKTPLPTQPPQTLSMMDFAKRDIMMEVFFKGLREFWGLLFTK